MIKCNLSKEVNIDLEQRFYRLRSLSNKITAFHCQCSKNDVLERSIKLAKKEINFMVGVIVCKQLQTK